MRKNEEEFFEFLNDFNDTKKPSKAPSLLQVHPMNPDPSPGPVVQRRRKTIKNVAFIQRQVSGRSKMLEEVCEEDEARGSIMSISDINSPSGVNRDNSGLISKKVGLLYFAS